ncbi:hypothetical protein [Glutamicibacter ardleyensis]|uniref:hypothetical protein n=1 Tax=Glutamicibacter ardleyensis TaxID=225894 RepID=UPI003FD27493
MTISSHLYKKSRDSEHGTWAVWGDPSGSLPISGDNLHFPADDESLLDVLHIDVVVVALNRGSKREIDGPPNFHTSVKSNDHLLGEALRGTPVWGAYMTDLVKDIFDPDATKAIPKSSDFDALLEEVRGLGATNPTFLVLGKQAHQLIQQLAAERKYPGKVILLPHYSGANNGNISRYYNEIFGPDSARSVSNIERYKTVVKSILDEQLQLSR